MPRTLWGTRWRSGVHGGRRPGAMDLHRRRALERRVCRLACLASASDRFAALQPISMGLAGLYGSTAAGAARGLALRMDHGSQYLSDHFTNQIKFWGIQPSYAFVAEPQTNGVAERFNRTLKEQIDPWSHLPQHRGAAGRRPRLRRTLQCPVDRRKERLPEPRSCSSRGNAAISIRPADETNLAKEPGGYSHNRGPRGAQDRGSPKWRSSSGSSTAARTPT